MKHNIFDSKGFLLDHLKWSPDIAYKIAQIDMIKLKKEHWLVLFHLRDLYLNKNIQIHDMRSIVMNIRLKYGENIGNSVKMYTLFPISPILQANKIAGLPRPNKCF